MSGQRSHQDRVAPSYLISPEALNLAHLSVDMKQAMKIPAAKKAVDAEWDELAIKSWDVNKPKPRSEVIKAAEARGISVHFGDLMGLCFLKHAELAEHLQVYKGRVVFRGDRVKDETTAYAVFTEQ